MLFFAVQLTYMLAIILPPPTDVVEGMTHVADYINEMQRVSEMYSSLFDVITSENTTLLPVRMSDKL